MSDVNKIGTGSAKSAGKSIFSVLGFRDKNRNGVIDKTKGMRGALGMEDEGFRQPADNNWDNKITEAEAKLHLLGIASGILDVVVLSREPIKKEAAKKLAPMYPLRENEFIELIRGQQKSDITPYITSKYCSLAKEMAMLKAPQTSTVGAFKAVIQETGRKGPIIYKVDNISTILESIKDIKLESAKKIELLKRLYEANKTIKAADPLLLQRLLTNVIEIIRAMKVNGLKKSKELAMLKDTISSIKTDAAYCDYAYEILKIASMMLKEGGIKADVRSIINRTIKAVVKSKSDNAYKADILANAALLMIDSGCSRKEVKNVISKAVELDENSDVLIKALVKLID